MKAVPVRIFLKAARPRRYCRTAGASAPPRYAWLSVPPLEVLERLCRRTLFAIRTLQGTLLGTLQGTLLAIRA